MNENEWRIIRPPPEDTFEGELVLVHINCFNGNNGIFTEEKYLYTEAEGGGIDRSKHRRINKRYNACNVCGDKPSNNILNSYILMCILLNDKPFLNSKLYEDYRKLNGMD